MQGWKDETFFHYLLFFQMKTLSTQDFMVQSLNFFNI